MKILVIFFISIPFLIALYLFAKTRTIEGYLERHRAEKTSKILILLFLIVYGIAVVGKFIDTNSDKDFLALFKFINKNDTIFNLMIGFLTVIGLLLAFIAIRGLFERIGTFEDLLETITEEVFDGSEKGTTMIMGYYLTFGVVTLGDSKKFKKYINSLEGKNLEIIIENPFERQLSLAMYCLNYGFKPEALKRIYHNLVEEPGGLSLYKHILTDDNRISLNDILDNKDKGWARFGASFIFNLYNEYLLEGEKKDVKYLGEDIIPDYHVCFSSLNSCGVIFIPLKIPEATESIRITNDTINGDQAEIIGWRTSDRRLLKRLEKNFHYYWNLNEAKERRQQEVITRNKNGELSGILVEIKKIVCDCINS